MGEKIYYILMGTALVALVVLLIALIACVVASNGKFEYTTPSGEKGMATSCYISYGSAHCATEDGMQLIVESFRKIEQ